MSYRFLKIGGPPHLRRITLARSDVRNAFNAEVITELSYALGELAEESELRVLVLAAEGETFCAGADFHWMSAQKDASFEENVADAHRLFDMFRALYDFPQPTIARVQGGAFGGGAGLVACADFVVMAEDAILSFSEVRIGLVPATISPFVIRKIGVGRARELFLTGDRISAARALEIGLANCVVASERMDAAVDEIAASLLRCGPEAVGVTKRLLEEVPLLSLDEARDVTARHIATRRISDEGQEGMAAFLEKRKPGWTK
ncbi:enoyl-CoA hydratase/isomerase family protein [bacterium]|nr:enoyl-CoA hydratase/isomerase family protein [bacterium]MBU1983262.1 enoyl-CoA hydratase/isomerase family protein [bacterium]